MEPDQALLRGIERGEAGALEELARRYAAPVYRYLVRLCGDPALAEDLAQETALQIWRALPGKRFPTSRALNAWVYTVATNALRMHVRRRRVGEAPLDAGVALAGPPEALPGAALEREELAAAVRAAVEALPEAERRAVLLKTYGDLRYHEIAAATGEPVGTVKWRISRAYARLRRLLTPAVGSAGEGEDDEHEPVRGPEGLPGRRTGVAGAAANGTPPAPVRGVLPAEGR